MARKRMLVEQREKGIHPYHSRPCIERGGKGWDEAGVCICGPSFQAEVWDKATKRPIKSPKFPTIAAARSWRLDALHDKKRGKLQRPSGQTFNEAADEWLVGVKAGTIRNRNRQSYKPSVIRTYETWLDARLRQQFGAHKIEAIRHVHAQDYADELIGEGLEPQTVANILMPGRAIYRRLRKRGVAEFNPFDGVELPASNGKRDLVASPKEAAAMVLALDDLADRAAWALMFYGGLRWGEVQDREVADYDSDQGTILVDSSWDRVEGSVAPKSAAGERIVPVCQHLRDYLDPYVESLGRDSGFLFPGETHDAPLDYGKARRRADAAWKAEGLRSFTPHNARHSFRSYLDAIPTISNVRADRYMGHANHSMGARYSHSLDGQLALDAAGLDEWLTAHETEKVVPLRATEAAA
jgi:integrase